MNSGQNIGAMKCPACESGNCRKGPHYADFPAFLFPMPESAAVRVRRHDLDLVLCGDCGHLFQPDPDRGLIDLIYTDYYAHYPYDGNEAMSRVYRQPFGHFSDLMLATANLPAEPRLLEIGCSKAENLRPFAETGFFCTGIDPSPLAAGAPDHPSVNMVSGYYEQTEVEAGFDVIVSRFNLEHIADLPAHVGKMRADVSEGGLVIVQVPNVEYYLDNMQPLFVAHEHIHYFSLRSLAALFARFGFAPVSIFAEGQPSILACFVRQQTGCRIEAPAISGRMAGFEREIETRREQLAARLQGLQKIVFYGCGLALFWALRSLPGLSAQQVHIVDDNKALAGNFLPSFPYRVNAPEPEVLAAANAVVLTLNPTYHDQVIERLRGYGQPMNVLKIGTEDIENVSIS